MVERTERDEPMWDQPEVHDVYRRWHRVLAEYGGDRMTVAEAWTQSPESLARFVRPDEMSQAFNFAWLLAPWSAQAFGDVIRSSLAQLTEVDAAPTWVLSNHDVVRHATRYGGGAVGIERAKAATLAMLALPGSAYLYQGEELGLENVDVPEEARQDPAWFRTHEHWRDGCRVPMPWSGDAPPYGFGTGERPALAPPARRLGRPHRRGAGPGPRLGAELLPRGPWPRGASTPTASPRPSSCSTPATTCSRSPAAR